jgi:hypothetical protein
MDAIPFSARLTCTVQEACQATGWCKNKIFDLIAEKRLDSRKVDRRRLIVVASLLRLLDLEPTAQAPDAMAQRRRAPAEHVRAPGHHRPAA